MSSLKRVKLSKEEKNLFSLLAFMNKTKNFNEQDYWRRKKKSDTFLWIVVVSCVLIIILPLLDFQAEVVLFSIFLCSVLCGVLIPFFQPFEENEPFIINSLVRDFFELKEVKPDLTVREYFEKSKAELMTQYQQKENERLDAIKERAKQIGVL